MMFFSKIRYWLQKYIGSILLALLMSLWSGVLCFSGLFYIFSCFILRSPASSAHKYANAWGWVLLKLSAFCVNIKVNYVGKVPQIGSIIASEHQSAYEIFALVAVTKNPIFVLKKSLIQIPIFGWLNRGLGMIPVDRNSLNKHWIEDAKKQLSLGRTLIIFPEGTRVEFGKEIDYKAGVFRLANTLNAPIFPVAIDAGKYWPRRAFFKEPGVVNIVFGDAYENPDKDGLREKIKQLLPR